MAILTREEVLARLVRSYSSYYNVTPLGPEEAPFVAECLYYADNTGYMLSKKFELWNARSFEHLFLLSVESLDLESYRALEQRAYERGMAKITPKPGHMYSFITPVIVCDRCTPEVIRAVKKCRIHKSFHFSLYGWMDYHAELVVLEQEQVYSNTSGQQPAKFLKKALFQSRRKKERKV